MIAAGLLMFYDEARDVHHLLPNCYDNLIKVIEMNIALRRQFQ